MYAKIKRIWELKERHVNKNVPIKYVFSLMCCYQRNCIHPLCKKGKPEVSPSRFLNGPPLSYFPLPTKDPLRSFGQDNCSKCPSKCMGHYLKLNLLIDAAIKGQELPPL